ncbi:MAG: hypothetical protein AAF292_12980 [Pseudomonadota bacterium]
MDEKRKDLDSERQKKLLLGLVSDLSASHPEFYYQSTIEIASLLKDHIDSNAKLSVEDKALLAPLSRHDIQLRLSLQ